MAAAAPAFLYGMAALAYPAFSCAVRPPPTGRRARQREASAA